MKREHITQLNKREDLFFFDYEAGRVVLMPKGWCHELADYDGSVLCWCGSEYTLAYKNRGSKEYLSSDSQRYYHPVTLEKFDVITEERARTLDPDLFELLDAVNSGEAK